MDTQWGKSYLLRGKVGRGIGKNGRNIPTFLTHEHRTGIGPSSYNACAKQDAKTNPYLSASPSILCISMFLYKCILNHIIVTASTTNPGSAIQALTNL